MCISHIGITNHLLPPHLPIHAPCAFSRVRLQVLWQYGRADLHGRAEGWLYYPSGVALDESSELLYVCNINNHKIVVLRTADGSFVGEFGSPLGAAGAGAGEFNAPWYATVWRGQLFVADCLNHRVQVLDAV